MSQIVKSVMICNIRDTTSYRKTNVLQDLHICISAPLTVNYAVNNVTENNTRRLTIRNERSKE